MKTKVFMAIAAAALTLTGFASPAKCSSISKAKSLAKTQSVTLVNEYDTDEKEYLDEGVAYYKIELKRGQAYTIWIQGGNASEMTLDVDTNWEYYDKDSKEDKEPGAGFDIEEINNSDLQYAYLYADDWDLEEDGDPKKGKYIVMITGNIGARTTLNYVQGIRSFTVTGTEESPKALSFAGKWKGISTKCIDGEYNMRATLKGGRKYRVYTSGGTKDNPLSLDIDDGNPDDDTNENAGEAQNEEIWEDPAYTNKVYDEAYIIVPEATGKYMFTVAGDVSQKFKFYYMEVPARAITSHPAIPLLKENDYSAKFVPGRMSSSNSYYDQIVDEHLCKIYLAKGERWVFDATGSNVPLQMYAYDSKGKIITSNDGIGNGSLDARVSVTATAAGIYYVGVCDPLLDITDQPDPGTMPVTLTARNATEFPAADDFDPADDTIAGANMLTPYPATTNDFALAATAASDALALGAINGGHALGQNDIYDVFAIPCRKGFTYRLKASWENDEETTDLDLGCKVFFQNGKAEKAITTTGSISPRDGEDLEFKAIANGMHYVRVFVANGLGLEYPPYKIHAIAANGMTPLGLVGASIEGGVGSWSLNKEDTKYPAGAVVAVTPPAAKTCTVKFTATTGFAATPASTVLEVPAWSEGAVVPMASAVYSDIYDVKYQIGTKKVYDKKKKNVSTPVYSPEDGDATPEGAFAITPAASAATLSRTFWKGDTADTFKFTAVADNYYNFKLTGTTNVHLVVSNAVTGAVVAEGTATADGNGVEIAKATLPAGLSYLIVSHVDEEDAGAPYKLTYSKATTGTVKFVMPTLTKTVNKKKVKYAADCYTVKEGVEYATLTVARTAKEGKVRVRYSTQAMSDEDAAAVGCLAAQPGVDYYPVVDGVVTWAAGDMKNKTIKVRTIPSHTGEWASSNRVFSVKLYPVDEEDDEFRDNGAEYLARVSATLASANVKITEADKVAPGVISLAMLDDFPVANAKKPAVTGKAGTEGAQLVFTRTGGTDGEVAINVTTPAVKGDTAKSGVDFALKSATRLVWADGDSEPKTLEIDFLPSSNLAVSKKFTLTMAAVKGTFTPSLAAKTAAVTITSDKVQNTAAAYAKQLVAANGGKIATSGSWYQDMAGELRSADGAAATITYTVAGPGLFRCRPQLIQPEAGDDGTLLCKIGKGTAFDCTGEEVVSVLPAGNSAITFSLTGVTGGAYMSFDPIEGAPYGWTAFSKTVPYNPMNGAVVTPDATDLTLTLPDALKALLGSGLHFRVRFGTTSKPTEVIAWDNDVVTVPTTMAAGKTYYWTVDYAWDAEAATPESIASWTAGPAVWKFSIMKEGQPVIAADYESVDAAGVSVESRLGADECLELIQGVKCSIRFTDNDSYEDAGEVVYRFAGGTLPKGMSVNATSGALAGAPTVVGETRALLQAGVKVTTKVKKNGKTTTKTTTTWQGSTVPVKIKVIPAGTSIGSFRGVLEEDGETFKTDPRRLGVVSFTAAAGNKLSASVTIGGVAYKFSGTTGYDEIVDRDDDQPGSQRHFRVKLTNTTKIAKKNYTNYLTLLVADGISTNLDALAACAGEVEELAINVANPKKTAVTAGVVYRGALYRNSGTVAVGAEVLKNFAGYYTMGLVPEGVTPDSGLPTGNGYLTMTVGATGSVSFSGALADGTAISGSSCAQLIGEPELDDVRKYVLSIPVYAGKTTTYAMNGVVQIAYELTDDGEFAATPVVLPQSKLTWAKPASAANSRDGIGFVISLAPTGGWYDKTANLQAYYLNHDFAVDTVETGDDLPVEALASGYSFSADSTPRDLGIKLTGNTLSAGTRSLVKTATTGLYDTWQHDPLTGESVAASVNPWAVAFKFNRANGIISGTLSAWEWKFKEDVDGFRYATAQKEIKKLAHKGVWLWSRDSLSESPLDDRAASAGYFLMPATKKWKASMPFNIITVSDDEKSWEEKELPSEE